MNGSMEKMSLNSWSLSSYYLEKIPAYRLNGQGIVHRKNVFVRIKRDHRPVASFNAFVKNPEDSVFLWEIIPGHSNLSARTAHTLSS